MPEKFYAYRAVVMRMASGVDASPEVRGQVAADREAREARRSANGVSGKARGIAILPMYGIISQRLSVMDELSGGGSMSTAQFSAALQDALNDDTVDSILIDIDSPGGNVYGVSELGDEIYAARGKKPIVGICNSLCASAAYWLGSQCDQLYCTPGGEVGSIGVICAHADYSKQNEMTGVAVSYITAGRYKSEMNPDEPLSDEARAYEQSRVDSYYSMFTKAVARGRGVPVADVRGDSFGQGRVMGAREGVANRLVDGIRTLPEVIARARDPRQPPGAANAAARAALARETLARMDAQLAAFGAPPRRQ